ncbi:Taurine hydroxylase-like protein SAT17 [Colletotrichum sp. SAR 10_99]|nr:Taurine hydroxylase-like protein SAT17 [Colletotrichum sp. SAR 10_96]KAJ5012086.1 Taurine hydroxylase-like protein SAT17 [Colletotrichum sp. SAR 10_99]
MSTITAAPETTTLQTWGYGLGLSSGQREPEYDLLEPYESMPEAIVGRTVWTKEDLEADTSRWLRDFTPDEVTHIESAVHDIEKNNLQLSEVDKSTFILPTSFAYTLASVRDELINGIGFVVLRGLPVHSWTTRQASIAYLGLGSYIGRRLSQNRQGHMLGHIKDLAEGKEINGEGRIYRTQKAQTYHSDESDIVGLLCLHQAMEGGQSQVVSTHHIYNILRKERPDVLRQLCLPHWFYDRKGETSQGENEWMRTPGYYYYKGKLSMKWDSYYVGALQRFWEAGLLPKYTDAQQEAIKVMEEMCHRLSLEMTLQQGDVQFVTNTHNLHARSAYKDDNDVTKKRWLQRLWLATSEEEGGWPLPFADSTYAKRGGVQVNMTPESYPTEAE